MPLAVLHAAQLVTLAGPKRPRVGAELKELAIVNDGGMLIRDGRIEQIGPSNEIAKVLSADTEVIDANGKVVLPGFVDAHAHPVFASNRVDEFEMRAQGATWPCDHICDLVLGLQSALGGGRSPASN